MCEAIRRMVEAEYANGRAAEDEAADARLQEFCDLINEIERRPDGETVILRALGILRILADGPDERSRETDWPWQLDR